MHFNLINSQWYYFVILGGVISFAQAQSVTSEKTNNALPNNDVVQTIEPAVYKKNEPVRAANKSPDKQPAPVHSEPSATPSSETITGKSKDASLESPETLSRKSSSEQKNQQISSHSSSEMNFDEDTLRSLGYGSEVADFFKDGSQFLPGQYDVTLNVNSSANYSASIMIGEQGQLCTTPVLQKTLKLRSVTIKDECTDLADLYPGAKVTPHPNNSTIDILVSEDDFDPLLKGNELTYGGFALLSNYRIYGMQMKGKTSDQHFYQGQFETGMNLSNWILRNNSSFSAGDNYSQYQFNETTLSRSIVPWKAQLQLGQISSRGSMFGGTPVNGVQIYSDSELQNTNKLIVPITGVAQTPATVEVMQNGRLLYRTLVPAGPFELDRINGVMNGQPLQVSVVQENGQRHNFSVVTSRERVRDVMSEPNYQFSIGQYRKQSGDSNTETPMVANLEGGVRYNNTDYTAGLQLSDIYQSIGGQTGHQWDENSSLYPLSVTLGGQYSRNKDQQGQQWDTSASTSFGAFSFGISSLFRTKEYPTLEESVQKEKDDKEYKDDEYSPSWWEDSQTQSNSSASVSWGNSFLGRFSYALGYTHYYGNRSDSILHTLNYGKKINRVSLTASYQGGNDRENRFFINASIPLGRESSLSAQMVRYKDDNTLTTTFNDHPGNLWGYSIGASKSSDSKYINGSINATTGYSQLNVSGSRGDEGNSSVMVTASGALAYSDGLFATSPVALGDTFGLIRVSDQSGVQVNTMGGGTTVTNHFGITAIPTLPINRKTTVQLDTKGLPLNVRLDTTSFDVAVARGTIITRDVSAKVMTQLLLDIKLTDGSAAPAGSSVIDEKGQLVAVVMGDGNVMLSNEQIGLPLRLRMTNNGDCTIKYPVPAHFDPDLLYEEANAVCQ